jgi:hypothetical protein
MVCVMEMTDILKQWVQKEWEPKHKGTGISLTDMCIPGTIWTMSTALEQLKTLDDELPHAYNIARDDGILRNGVMEPCPCINEYEIPTATPVCDTLEQIKNVFKWILLMMKLLDAAVQPSFWIEVARAEGRDIDHAKEQWNLMEQNLSSAVTDIQSFVAGAQTDPVADNPGTVPVHIDLQPAAQFTALLERLRACTV